MLDRFTVRRKVAETGRDGGATYTHKYTHSDSILRVFELFSKLFEFLKRKEKSGNQNYPKSLVFIFLT